MKSLEALKRLSRNSAFYENDYKDYQTIEKELKALEILSEYIIINEKNGYVEFQCGFSLPTNSKYENEEHFKEKIDLLKEALKEN